MGWVDHYRYTLYYDETNNIRRLTLTDSGLNHDALDCFVLGGIALEPGAALPDIAALRALLRIQESAPEMKLKHLVQGTCQEFCVWRGQDFLVS